MRPSLGALALATALIAGCGRQPATPSPSATAAATARAPASTPAPTPVSTPTPTPTLTGTPAPPSLAPPTPSPTSPLSGTAALILPPGTVRTIDLAEQRSGSSFWSFPAKPGRPPTGPYVYLGADPETPFAYGLSVADLGGGSVRALPLRSLPYESVASALVEGHSLVVLVWRHEGPLPARMGIPCYSDSGKPIAWRLLTTSLGADGLPTGGWHQVDAGVATRRFADPDAGINCDDPIIPAVAVADGRVAYAVDHPTSQYPAGSRIVLRSLGGGTVQRVIDTATQVTHLALSASSVAWVESPNADASGPVTRWRVMRAPVATGLAEEVSIRMPGHLWRFMPPGVVLDGDAVLATPGELVLGWSSVVRSEGSSVVALNPSGTPYCAALGASSGVAVLTCSVEGSDDAIATWSAATGLHVLAGVLPAAYRSERIDSGTVAWTFFKGPNLTQPVLMGVPLAALVAGTEMTTHR
jgi:hypothetical protein